MGPQPRPVTHRAAPCQSDAMSTLFEAAAMEKGAPRPMADRLRPKWLAEVAGEDHLVGPDGTLTRMLA